MMLRLTANSYVFYILTYLSVIILNIFLRNIENIYNKPINIIEVQIGSILKETDIIRYKDIYGRIN